MELIVFISVFIFPCFIIKNAQGFNTCNEKETCISLYDCPELSKLVFKSNRTYAESTYVSSKQCGFENKQVFLCCELITSGRSSFGDFREVSEPVNSVTYKSVISSRSGRGNILPSLTECGPELSNRIVGGIATHVYEFPWMAMLEYKKSNGHRVYLCGGSLINHRYVLTAAHCVDVVDMVLTGVRLAEWDRRTNPDCETYSSGQTICTNLSYVNLGIAETLIHENYDYNSLTPHNDIALIRLMYEVEYNDMIRPICLPKENLLNELFIGSKMDVSGWGFTEENKQANVKTKAEVQVWSLEDCLGTYQNENIISTQICAGGEENVDACAADSGGPLMTIYQHKYVLAGIVSFGPVACGTKDKPGVYTRVASFKDWIVRSLKP